MSKKNYRVRMQNEQLTRINTTKKEYFKENFNDLTSNLKSNGNIKCEFLLIKF